MRLFVAVNLPEATRAVIHQAAEPLRAAGYPIRWVDPQGVHLTLKFLGEVPDERVAEIGDALARACDGTRAFDLPLEGFGAFPHADRPRVVWIGCESVSALELLQHAVEREMAAIGFPLEGRPFRPHLTIGRARRGAGKIPGLADQLADLRFAETVRVTSVELMQSRLGREGARYEERVRVGLG